MVGEQQNISETKPHGEVWFRANLKKRSHCRHGKSSEKTFEKTNPASVCWNTAEAGRHSGRRWSLYSGIEKTKPKPDPFEISTSGWTVAGGKFEGMYAAAPRDCSTERKNLRQSVNALCYIATVD